MPPNCNPASGTEVGKMARGNGNAERRVKSDIFIGRVRGSTFDDVKHRFGESFDFNRLSRPAFNHVAAQTLLSEASAKEAQIQAFLELVSQATTDGGFEDEIRHATVSPVDQMLLRMNGQASVEIKAGLRTCADGTLEVCQSCKKQIDRRRIVFHKAYPKGCVECA